MYRSYIFNSPSCTFHMSMQLLSKSKNPVFMFISCIFELIVILVLYKHRVLKDNSAIVMRSLLKPGKREARCAWRLNVILNAKMFAVLSISLILIQAG